MKYFWFVRHNKCDYGRIAERKSLIMFVKANRLGDVLFNEKGTLDIIGETYINKSLIETINVIKKVNPAGKKEIVSEIILTSGKTLLVAGRIEV